VQAIAAAKPAIWRCSSRSGPAWRLAARTNAPKRRWILAAGAIAATVTAAFGIRAL